MDALVADMDGSIALPRRNGELTFEQPWQGRAFATAVALTEVDTLEWESFRQALIAEIGRWEREEGEDPREEWSYYERWLTALEGLLVERAILDPEAIRRRASELAHAQEHEHDHDREHDHQHEHDHD